MAYQEDKFDILVVEHCHHDEGGRKAHMSYDGKILCGTRMPDFIHRPGLSEYVSLAVWIDTGMRSNQLCLKCGRKAQKIMNDEKL